MLRRVVLAALIGVASLSVHATTQVGDISAYIESSKAQIASGRLTELDFYRNLHALIADTSASSYPNKLQSLRYISERIDILEAVKAGRITDDKARRLFAEQEAAKEDHDLKAAREDLVRRQMQMEAQSQAEAQQQAQDHAQRRALAVQLIQSGAFRPPVLQPYIMPTRPSVNCTSYKNGNQVQTTCN